MSTGRDPFTTAKNYEMDAKAARYARVTRYALLGLAVIAVLRLVGVI